LVALAWLRHYGWSAVAVSLWTVWLNWWFPGLCAQRASLPHFGTPKDIHHQMGVVYLQTAVFYSSLHVHHQIVLTSHFPILSRPKPGGGVYLWGPKHCACGPVRAAARRFIFGRRSTSRSRKAYIYINMANVFIYRLCLWPCIHRCSKYILASVIRRNSFNSIPSKPLMGLSTCVWCIHVRCPCQVARASWA